MDFCQFVNVFDHVVKENRINVCFFVVFESQIISVLQFFCLTTRIPFLWSTTSLMINPMTHHCLTTQYVCIGSVTKFSSSTSDSCFTSNIHTTRFQKKLFELVPIRYCNIHIRFCSSWVKY